MPHMWHLQYRNGHCALPLTLFIMAPTLPTLGTHFGAPKTNLQVLHRRDQKCDKTDVPKFGKTEVPHQSREPQTPAASRPPWRAFLAAPLHPWWWSFPSTSCAVAASYGGESFPFPGWRTPGTASRHWSSLARMAWEVWCPLGPSVVVWVSGDCFAAWKGRQQEH